MEIGGAVIVVSGCLAISDEIGEFESAFSNEAGENIKLRDNTNAITFLYSVY